MYDIVSRVFVSFFLIAYSVLLIALAAWALSARPNPAVKDGIGSALVRVVKGFHFRVRQLKGEGLKLRESTRSSFSAPSSGRN